jgi:hypothetical protein
MVKKWLVHCEVGLQAFVQEWERQILQASLEKQDSSQNQSLAMDDLA